MRGYGQCRRLKVVNENHVLKADISYSLDETLLLKDVLFSPNTLCDTGRQIQMTL